MSILMTPKYLIEWISNDGIKDSTEILTDDIDWTLEQVSRNRNIKEFTKVKKLTHPKNEYRQNIRNQSNNS